MRYVIAIGLLSGLLWGQSTFVCPDPKAKQACASLAEDKEHAKLLKAKNTLVCFREEKDQYFTIDLRLQDGNWEWDNENHALTRGIVAPELETIDHGTSNPELMPTFLLLKNWGIGSWQTRPPFSSVIFKPSQLTGLIGDSSKDNLNDFAFYIGDSTLELSIPYQNRDEQTVTYSLSVTLSTNRFRESWRGPVGLPQDQYGRCVGKITLPSQKTLKAAMPVITPDKPNTEKQPPK
jgi:hypothetical protein